MLLSAIYWLTVKLYAGTLHIASLYNQKAKLFIQGRRGLFLKIENTLKNEMRPCIWMHCASLGEFEQGRPVLESIKKQYPSYVIVLTFFSPSGYEVRKHYEGADHVFYLPLDSSKNAKQFLDILQPKLCVFVKYELWYYYLTNIARLHIPAILISARFRKDQLFFKFYGELHRKMLSCFKAIFVQDEVSKTLLQNIGYKNVIVNGDTRFDRVLEASIERQELPIATSFCKEGKIFIAGSTWRADEVFLQRVYSQLPSHWKMILVPHEVDEAHIEAIEKLYAGETIRWSAWKEDTHKRMLIVDKIGLLMQLYWFGNMAWIGGGFDKEGVHNVLEAAVYGVPCFFGPIFHQFIEAGELIQAGGAITFEKPSDYLLLISRLENDKIAYEKMCNAAKQYVISKAGATIAILNYLEEKKLLSTP